MAMSEAQPNPPPPRKTAPTLSEPFCLRCKSVELEVLPLSGDRITFYGCPKCGRHFAQKPGRSLTERWLGPLSVVLYDRIFSKRPQDDAERIAANLRKTRTSQQIAWIISEIQEELAHPTQQVRDILDQPQAEADLREFLTMVADNLDQHEPHHPVGSRHGFINNLRGLPESAPLDGVTFEKAGRRYCRCGCNLTMAEYTGFYGPIAPEANDDPPWPARHGRHVKWTHRFPEGPVTCFAELVQLPDTENRVMVWAVGLF